MHLYFVFLLVQAATSGHSLPSQIFERGEQSFPQCHCDGVNTRRRKRNRWNDLWPIVAACGERTRVTNVTRCDGVFVQTRLLVFVEARLCFRSYRTFLHVSHLPYTTQ